MTSPPIAPAYAVERAGPHAPTGRGACPPLTLVVAPAGAGKVGAPRAMGRHSPGTGLCLDGSRCRRRRSRAILPETPLRARCHQLGFRFPRRSDLFAWRWARDAAARSSRGTDGDLPEVVIVLDDLHHLSNAVLISDLGRLANLLPPNIHLVLSTRTDLPIAWSRHRVRRPTDRDPPVRPRPRRDRLCPVTRAHHRSTTRHRQGGRSGRPNRGVGGRTATGGNDTQALRRSGRVHHPIQWGRPAHRGLPQRGGPSGPAG